MKKNVTIIVEAVLILLAVITIIFMFQDRNSQKDELIAKNKEVTELKEYIEVQDNGNNTTDISEKVKFINSGFSYYLNYNTDNYQSRFEDVSKYFSPEVIDKLSGAGSTEKPTISIQSSTNDYKTFINPSEPNSFVYVTDIHYQVEENEPTVFNNVYLVNLTEKDGKYIVDNIDVYSGTPTNQ